MGMTVWVHCESPYFILTMFRKAKRQNKGGEGNGDGLGRGVARRNFQNITRIAFSDSMSPTDWKKYAGK